jgi:CheY-like chemotaxis protein
VEADVAQFETAIVNMAVNARDAMDSEGELKIAITRRAATESQFVSVEVIDTGHGIDPDKVDRIFEPFFTTKDVGKGTGLGLSQVYGFTKQSEGEINVESTVGVGTVFRLLLPARDDRPLPPEDPREAEAPRKGGRVLIVEDNADVRSFAVDLLGDLGFDADVAASGQAALDILSTGAEFDVIFSDVVMPGMSGVDFALTVRERLPGMPIVLTSGYSHVLVEEGRHGFPLLHKPYSAEDVARALHQAVRPH